MRSLARQTALLALAAALSWWLFLARDPQTPTAAPKPPGRTMPVALTPVVASGQTVAARTPPAQPAEPAPPEANEHAPDPPPQPDEFEEPDERGAPAVTELGTPEGSDELPPTPAPEAAEPEEARMTAAEDAGPADAETAERGREPTELMRDAALLDAARDELEGKASRGFQTVLLAAPEDQLEIARFFGEEIVLVPRSAIDPEEDNPRYFRAALAGTPRIERVGARPPLDRFRRYRDLFDYEYARLPDVLRELRKSVLTRSEVYLFGALIPVREWALVVGRRAEALELVGRELEDVRTFLMRYRQREDGGFDIQVEEVVFADGSRFRPNPKPKKTGV